MSERISVPLPSEEEERRLLAESIADLHEVCDSIVENANQFIPGEAIEELSDAWHDIDTPDGPFTRMVNELTATPGSARVVKNLRDEGLLGWAGAAKRKILGRLKDAYYRFKNSEPTTRKKLRKAAEAAVEYLEYGSTVVSSMRFIPGYHQVVELLKLFKQLLSIRLKRGH